MRETAVFFLVPQEDNDRHTDSTIPILRKRWQNAWQLPIQLLIFTKLITFWMQFLLPLSVPSRSDGCLDIKTTDLNSSLLFLYKYLSTDRYFKAYPLIISAFNKSCLNRFYLRDPTICPRLHEEDLLSSLLIYQTTSCSLLSLHIWDICIIHQVLSTVNPYLQHFFNFM